MAGLKKKGPSRKGKKAKRGVLAARLIMRGKSAKLRRSILPV